MSISASAVTRMGLGGAMWVPLHTTFPAKTEQIVASLYNAIGYFTTGGSVTIVIYDLVDDSIVATSSDVCREIASTGVYVWGLDALTVQPNGYKQYGWRMTDGSTFDAGEVTHPEPMTFSRLNPVTYR